MKPESGFCRTVCDRKSGFADTGFEIFAEVLSGEECDALSRELTLLFEQRQDASRRTIGGIRNILRASPQAAMVACSQKVVSLVEERIGSGAFPVRGIFFDKRSGANWGVPWHQDLAIAVAQRIETTGFGPWSTKEGVVHVQPPREVLEGMLVVRLHLDDCDASNGALKLIPGSHLQGELRTDEIRDWCRRAEPILCEVPRGGALLMRPLILHASSAATNAAHRRVLHVEYAVRELPGGLRWFERS